MDKIETYIDQVLRQRRDRENTLVSSSLNWFSLSGLFPLKSGENSIGTGTGYAINIAGLRDGAMATISVEGSAISLIRVNDAFTINGATAKPEPLRPDIEGDPDLLECGSIAMMVIKRGDRYLLRAWDREAAALKGFRGLNYYPVDPDSRITAEYLPLDPPKRIIIQDAIGSETESVFPGLARFKFNGKNCSLIAEDGGDELLFSFTDLTRHDATYPGGRYLLTEKPADRHLVLDFNLARNWPCAYTPYATCPLPPSENHLGVRVEAGEKRYQSH